MELHIDEEFQGLLPQLTDEERNELEKQIKRDGVLNPIIVWNGTIVDGHNRYMICKMNGITEFPVRKIKFDSRDDVIKWILEHQLGRRNLSDFQRTRIALRYEEIIAKKAKERQLSGLKHVGKSSFSSMEQNDKKDSHTTRNEIAKIAGTSGTAVQRTKYILENGTEEQIARAEKGGKEMDGRSNSIRAIAEEIKEGKSGSKVCKMCGNTLPLTEFYIDKGQHRRTVCKKCYNSSYKADIKGNINKSSCLDISEAEMTARLYDDGKEVVFTTDDLLEEVRTNGEEAIRTIHTTFVLHKELLVDSDCKEKVNDLIAELIESLRKTTEVKEDEGI